jgi:hypothetical protein
MDVDKYIFKTKREALIHKGIADVFWINYTYDGTYIPLGKVIGIKIVKSSEEAFCDEMLEDDSPNPEFYAVVNEYWEYMVNKETVQWELIA